LKSILESTAPREELHQEHPVRIEGDHLAGRVDRLLLHQVVTLGD
jgi:hypothetical protein